MIDEASNLGWVDLGQAVVRPILETMTFSLTDGPTPSSRKMLKSLLIQTQLGLLPHRVARLLAWSLRHVVQTCLLGLPPPRAACLLAQRLA
jgi:hypothetical protein